MILSTKGRYAVMAMVDLAARETEEPVALSAIAERQDIPLNYLEQLFSRLKKAELVAARRGPGGGYALAKPAADISIAEIIMAADESLKMTRCGADSPSGCIAYGTRCMTHDLWHGLTRHIQEYLRSISLEDVYCQRLPDLDNPQNDKLIQVIHT